MIPEIKFSKLSGCGNDFICIDNRNGCFDEMLASEKGGHFVRSIAHRGFGVGADGVIFAGPTGSGEGVDIFARFFEPDGSETELCGNGTGCFVRWVVSKGWVPDREIRILTSAGVAKGHCKDKRHVRICIPTPEDIERDIKVETDGRQWNCDYIVAGVPHAIIHVDDIEEIDVEHWGRAIRHHERFQPRGVNVNFVEVIEEGSIAVRTFEYGVEGETLACGTGSAAAAVMTATRLNWHKDYLTNELPVRVTSRGCDVLSIWFILQDDGSMIDVCLDTVVRPVFDGVIHPSLTAEALGISEEKMLCRCAHKISQRQPCPSS